MSLSNHDLQLDTLHELRTLVIPSHGKPPTPAPNTECFGHSLGRMCCCFWLLNNCVVMKVKWFMNSQDNKSFDGRSLLDERYSEKFGLDRSACACLSACLTDRHDDWWVVCVIFIANQQDHSKDESFSIMSHYGIRTRVYKCLSSLSGSSSVDSGSKNKHNNNRNRHNNTKKNKNYKSNNHSLIKVPNRVAKCEHYYSSISPLGLIHSAQAAVVYSGYGRGGRRRRDSRFVVEIRSQLLSGTDEGSHRIGPD